MRSLAAAALATTFFVPVAGFAQGTMPTPLAEAGVPASNVIIVTARKREENLADVPLSITAISGEEIDAAGLENISDIAEQTPGFSFHQAFGRAGAPRPAIRGMSNILGAPNAGFFVDGIFVSGNITSYQLDNLERVEVIRGPQAALFGRQTFSGAVNYVTRKPDRETRGAISQTIGQYDNFETSGYIAGPINDGLAYGEIYGRFYTFGGDYINADSGKRDINDQQSWNVGGKVRLTPTSNLEAIFQAAYGSDTDKGYATYKLGSDKLNCFLPEITGTAFRIPLSRNRSRGYFCGEIEQPDELAYNNDAVEALGFDVLDRQYFRSDLTLTYSFDSGWELTSVTAYNDSDLQTGFDNELTPSTNPSLAIQATKAEDFSQNVRLLTPQNWPVRGLLGAYYFRQRDGRGYNVNTTSTSARFGARNRFDSADGINNYAIYGLVEADITARLTVSAEARYQEDEILGSDENDGGSDAITPPTNLRSVKYKSFLPRGTIRYELSPLVNLYGSIAKGNKPGGFNDLPSDALPSFNADFLAAGLDTFDEEEVWSYELGLKGYVGDSGIYFNAAAYYIDWTQQQLTQSQPYGRPNGSFNTQAFIVNAGTSQIKGFEIETGGNVTDWLSFRAGYSYTDAEFTDFYDENTEELLDTDGRPSFLDADQMQLNPADVDGPNGQVAGNKLPQTPMHQFNLSGTATFPLGRGETSLFFRTDFNYESNRFAQVHNLARTGDSYNLNLRAGIELGDLTFTAFVDNVLEDKTPRAITRLFDFNRGLLVPDPVRSFIFLPNRRFTFYRDFIAAAPRKRQFGATVRYRF